MSGARSYRRVGPGKIRPIAVFDFETLGLGGKILAATWKRETDEKAHYISGKNVVQEMFYIMCENHEFDWYAHNAQYDLRYIFENLSEQPENLKIYLRTDNDIFMVTLRLPEYGEKATLVIKDSYAFFPYKLKDFAECMCPELPKLDFDWTSETFNPKNETHIAYALRDADSLLLAIKRFDETVMRVFDVHLKATAASTALAAWQRGLGKNEHYSPPSGYDDFIRASYYGGLVFLTDTNIVYGANTFDLNSSYPFNLMANDYPIGNPVRTKFFNPSYLGIYDVTVKAPDNLIVPIIPKRDNKGIVWPSGVFQTIVTSIDLQFALENGYRLLAVRDGLIWEKTCSPFRSFVEKCRSIRQNHKGTPLEFVAKLMQNSLYGKFGTKKIRRKIYAYLPDQEQLGCDTWGDYLVRDEIDETMLALPQWAAFCTSYARRLLLRFVYEYGPENAIYGDTDSITFRRHIKPPTGLEYGQLKLEKEWHSFRARSPKVYSGKLTKPDKHGNIATGAIKGVPKKKWASSEALEMVYSGANKAIFYEVLPPLIQILKGNPGHVYEAHRRISEISNSRNWSLRQDGTVRPKTWAQIESETTRKRGGTSEAFRARVAEG